MRSSGVCGTFTCVISLISFIFFPPMAMYFLALNNKQNGGEGSKKDNKPKERRERGQPSQEEQREFGNWRSAEKQKMNRVWEVHLEH